MSNVKRGREPCVGCSTKIDDRATVREVGMRTELRTPKVVGVSTRRVSESKSQGQKSRSLGQGLGWSR